VEARGKEGARRSQRARERERKRRIGENSLSIHAVYTRRTLELKIEPGNGGARAGVAHVERTRTAKSGRRRNGERGWRESVVTLSFRREFTSDSLACLA